MLQFKKKQKSGRTSMRPFLRKCSLASLILLSGINASFAQRKCGTMEYLQYQIEQDSSIKTILEQTEQSLLTAPDAYERKIGINEVLVIPVVVHVVYHNAADNISAAQIESQISALNHDYRRLNSDKTNTPSAFAPVAADPHIQFRLAGTTRTKTKTVSFTQNDNVKFTSKGGINAWDAKKYLNIWVCNLGNGLLGYAQFPGMAAQTDGVVIKNTAFGTVGTAKAPFALGRTATHEIGHWLNLFHIWGDKTNCKGTDFVDDTPQQGASNYGCPDFPHTSCNNGPKGDMFMNYMDYTDDNCMNIFTKGQKKRMQAVIANVRTTIADVKGLTLVGKNKDGNLTTMAPLPDGTKAGDWTFQTSNTIAGTADFNGDGFTDVLVTSSWGIGILTTKGGDAWTSLLAKPLDTKFGKWLYNSDNSIEGIADFNGDGKQDILVRTDNHIGILTLKGKTFTALTLANNNAVLGKWRYNDSKMDVRDSIRQIGDFNGDQKADICLTSAWGMGILTLEGTKFSSLLSIPNNTDIDSWQLNTNATFFPLKGDFNKDKKEDLVVINPDGIAILSLQESTLHTLATGANNSIMGAWHYNNSDNDHKDILRLTGDFDGDGQSDLLLTSEWGIGILTLKENTLTSLIAVPNQTSFDHWVYDSEGISVLGTADLTGIKKDAVILANEQGIALLQLDGNTFKTAYQQDFQTSIDTWNFTNEDLHIASSFANSKAVGPCMLFKSDLSIKAKSEDSNQNLTTSATNVSPSAEKTQPFVLYPNPASQNITLQFTLLQRTKISFSLYNIQGMKVLEFAPAEEQHAGHYSKVFDLTPLVSGSYTYVFEAGLFHKSDQIIVLEKQ
jgi:hypothetical protein